MYKHIYIYIYIYIHICTGLVLPQLGRDGVHDVLAARAHLAEGTVHFQYDIICFNVT